MGFHGPDFPNPVTLIIAGCAVGAVIGIGLALVTPWLWSLIRPWLHAVTG